MKRLRIWRRWFARRFGYARLACLGLLVLFAGLRIYDPAPVEEIRVRLNPKLLIHGVVLTMYDQRTTLADQVVDDVRRVLGDKVYATIIPRNVRVAESPSHGKPVLLYDYRCSGSQAYIRLASEVIERERRMRAA